MHKDTGVKKLLILALAPNTQENYKNISLLWKILNINSCNGTKATDLKLANILTGQMTHACNYPCTWCYAEKNNLLVCGERRTIGNSSSNYQEWFKSGGVRKAKKFKNCVNPPIFCYPEDTEILDIIAPPELHLMIGSFNTVLNHMLIEYEDFVAEWTENFEKDISRYGASFNGNYVNLF